MPIYEYRCRACEAEFEKLTSARATVTCARCGSPQVMRLLSVFGTMSHSQAPGPAQCPMGPAAGGCCGGGACGLG